jgi:hypothetical protein
LKSLGKTRLVWHVIPFGQSRLVAHIGRSPLPVHVAAHAIDVYVVPVWFVVPQQISPRPHSEFV